ncbi:MAG TPA: alkaline phosphatase family protein, partial [Acidobacteriaceae bacterium]|nr:alkaline phosphatase family protein [Acidobacteriaceae bacterium]
IDGARPGYYLKYDERYPEEKRADQVIAWLRLPPALRPHFIALYDSSVDRAGHTFGPESAQTAEAVRATDRMVGKLWEEISSLNLPVDLIVVSDHGMEQQKGSWINLDKYADLSNFIVVGSLLYPKSEASAERAYQQLKIKTDEFTVYRRSRLPAGLHYSSNPRAGDPVILVNGPYAVRAHAPPANGGDLAPEAGVHGYDPGVLPSMRAFFLAVGPDIRPGSTLRPFENVNVYPLVTRILGLESPPVDGSVNILSGILK